MGLVRCWGFMDLFALAWIDTKPRARALRVLKPKSSCELQSPGTSCTQFPIGWNAGNLGAKLELLEFAARVPRGVRRP